MAVLVLRKALTHVRAHYRTEQGTRALVHDYQRQYQPGLFGDQPTKPRAKLVLMKKPTLPAAQDEGQDLFTWGKEHQSPENSPAKKRKQTAKKSDAFRDVVARVRTYRDSVGADADVARWQIEHAIEQHGFDRAEVFGKETPEKRPLTLAQKVVAAEGAIRHDISREHCFVFDGQGKVILTKAGDRSSITFTKEEMLTLVATPNVIFTHNHPQSYSFSVQDVVMAARIHVTEMRAVGPHITYTMRPPAGGWPAWEELVRAYQECDSAIRIVLMNAIADNRMSVEDAEATHGHDVMYRLSRRYQFL